MSINHPNRSKVNDWPRYLKEFRASHCFTQRQLANHLQTSLRNVENWEGGLTKPPAFLKKALSDIAKSLNV